MRARYPPLVEFPTEGHQSQAYGRLPGPHPTPVQHWYCRHCHDSQPAKIGNDLAKEFRTPGLARSRRCSAISLLRADGCRALGTFSPEAAPLRLCYCGFNLPAGGREVRAFIGRREFSKLLVGVVAWPLSAWAEPADRMRRIGVLMGVAKNDPEGQARVAAFQQGLAELNWADGRNVQIDYRWAAGDTDRIRAYTAELVALAPDVLVGNGTSALTALRDATQSIPIVFVLVNDPVGQGFIDNLARPGGNITGFSFLEYSMIWKSLELLRQLAPSVHRLAIMFNPTTAPHYNVFLRSLEAVPPPTPLDVKAAPVGTQAAIEQAVAKLAKESDSGLLVPPDTYTIVHRRLVISSAAQHRLPAIFTYRQFVREGALITYGPETTAIFHRAASYVDRILRGANPGDLPAQAPTKFELAVNLRTARTLGLEVPPTLLALADEVIE